MHVLITYSLRLWFPDYLLSISMAPGYSLLLSSPLRYTGVTEHIIIENIHPLSCSARISARVPPCTHTSIPRTPRSHTFLPPSQARLLPTPERDLGTRDHPLIDPHNSRLKSPSHTPDLTVVTWEYISWNYKSKKMKVTI